MVNFICLTYCFFFSVIAAFDFISYFFKFKCFILIPRYPFPSINWVINYHNLTYEYCEQSDANHKIIINSRTTSLRLSWLIVIFSYFYHTIYLPIIPILLCYLNLTFVFFSALIVHCHIHMILRHEKIPCRINDSIILLIHLSMEYC